MPRWVLQSYRSGPILVIPHGLEHTKTVVMASKFLPSSKLSPVSTKRPASMAGFGKQVSKYTYDYVRLHQPALLTQQSKRTLWAERFTSSLASSTVYWLPRPLCLHKAALFVGKLTRGTSTTLLLSERPLWYHTCGLPQMDNHSSASALGSDDVAQFVCGSLLVTPVSPSESCQVVEKMTLAMFWVKSEEEEQQQQIIDLKQSEHLSYSEGKKNTSQQWLTEYFETPAVPHQAAGQDVHAQRPSRCVYRGCDAGRLASHLANHHGWEPRSPGRFDRYTSAIPSLGIVAIYVRWITCIEYMICYIYVDQHWENRWSDPSLAQTLQ